MSAPEEVGDAPQVTVIPISGRTCAGNKTGPGHHLQGLGCYFLINTPSILSCVTLLRTGTGGGSERGGGGGGGGVDQAPDQWT